MKTILTTLFSLFFCLVSHAALAQSHYKIGISDSFQPFNYRGVDGQLKGFNVDIANAVCKEMRSTCEFVVMSFPQVIPALEQGQIDFATSNFLITPERAKRINFSDKYYRSTTSLIGSINAAHQTPEEILNNAQVSVATQQGSTQSRYLKKNSQVQLREIKSIGSGLELLRNKEADYLIAPTLFALNFLQKPENMNLDFIGNPIDHPSLSGSVHIGISKHQPELKTKIDTALANMLKNGRLRTIINQYFPFDVY